MIRNNNDSDNDMGVNKDARECNDNSDNDQK